MFKINRSVVKNVHGEDDFELTEGDFNRSLPDARLDAEAIRMFALQYAENDLYRGFCDCLGRSPGGVVSVQEIPFLPISFFKTHLVACGKGPFGQVFESSGTTGASVSRHHVLDTGLYRRSFTEAFRLFYGEPRDWCILALLPSYLERRGSSLVTMADDLIRQSGDSRSGFYLDQFDDLADAIRNNERQGRKTLLLGVTFALLDFAERHPMQLGHTMVMETGGMKGRRRELTREEVHAILCKAFSIPVVHSEYGMTELLSQAYSKGHGRFSTPPWMRILLRSEDDPLCLANADGSPLDSGLINVIDMANRHSCSFIATDDLGRLHLDGTFEVIGRLDNSDIRGCSLLAV
jgi:hypothetical protein